MTDPQWWFNGRWMTDLAQFASVKARDSLWGRMYASFFQVLKIAFNI
jgi:hypothetical protein